MIVYRKRVAFQEPDGLSKVQGRTAKVSTKGSKRCLRRTLSAVSPMCSNSPLQSARKTEPVPRLSRLLFLSLSIIRSLSSPNRAVDPSKLEVTTGHRLNQSINPISLISLSPTRVLSYLLFFLFSPSFSLFPFSHLTSRGLIFVYLSSSLSSVVLLSPRLSFLPVSSRLGSFTGRDVRGFKCKFKINKDC